MEGEIKEGDPAWDSVPPGDRPRRKRAADDKVCPAPCLASSKPLLLDATAGFRSCTWFCSFGCSFVGCINYPESGSLYS